MQRAGFATLVHNVREFTFAEPNHDLGTRVFEHVDPTRRSVFTVLVAYIDEHSESSKKALFLRSRGASIRLACTVGCIAANAEIRRDVTDGAIAVPIFTSGGYKRVERTSTRCFGRFPDFGKLGFCRRLGGLHLCRC